MTKSPLIEYPVSECCLANVEDMICAACGETCDIIFLEEEFFDEVKSDDERHEAKQNQETE